MGHPVGHHMISIYPMVQSIGYDVSHGIAYGTAHGVVRGLLGTRWDNLWYSRGAMSWGISWDIGMGIQWPTRYHIWYPTGCSDLPCHNYDRTDLTCSLGTLLARVAIDVALFGLDQNRNDWTPYS